MAVDERWPGVPLLALTITPRILPREAAVLFDTFSKRLRRTKMDGQPEIYTYDSLPQPLRVQICHILRDALGVVGETRYSEPQEARRWRVVFDIVCREIGVFNIGDDFSEVDLRCQRYFMGENDVLKAIDFIEIAFKAVKAYGMRLEDDIEGSYVRQNHGGKVNIQDAIGELNARFREHGIGYIFEGNEIIRVDNTLIHSEITKPALYLLADKIFLKANDDFFLAHDHYRHGNYKDCIVAAQRSFESTMKAVCTKMAWTFKPSDRASDLIKVLRANGLFPDYLDSGFDSYIAMLKTGLPEIRNNAGGHGSHPESPAVPDYIASYALHMTAVNIVLIAEALKRRMI